MKAVKLYGPNDVRLVDAPLPAIGDDELLLRTKAAAICGSDLRMIQNGYQGVSVDSPLVLGHEFAGTIEKAGKNVKGFVPGQSVSVAPNIGCGHCDACVRGNSHLCPDYQAFGINLDGGFAEFIRITEPAVARGNLTVLPDGVDFAQASIIEPFSCVLNGQEIVQVKLNDRVAVIGAGPIGIMHAMLAKAFGASKVMITDINQARLDQCAQIDADFIPLRSDDLREEIMRHTDGEGLDVCIVACPSPRAQEESLGFMATNGRILYFGGLPVNKDKITISSNTIHYKQLRVCGATRANVFQYRKIASMIENKRMDLKPLISATYPIDEFGQAVEYAKSGIGIKTVIVF